MRPISSCCVYAICGARAQPLRLAAKRMLVVVSGTRIRNPTMSWTMPCWKRLTGLSCRNVVMGHVPARTLWTVPFCGDPLPNVTIHEHPGTIVPRFGSIQVVSPILECVHTHIIIDYTLTLTHFWYCSSSCGAGFVVWEYIGAAHGCD